MEVPLTGFFLALGLVATVLLGGAAFVTIMLHRAEKAEAAEKARQSPRV